MRERGIILAEVGERGDQIRSLIRNVRTVSDLPIVIYSDRPYENLGSNTEVKLLSNKEKLQWQGHRRYHNRQNDFWKIIKAPEEFEQVLILDDDMRIVNEDFAQGFDIAHRFGMCLPINPRTYVGLDVEVGDDVDSKVKDYVKSIGLPYYLTANNMGMIFIDNSCYGTDKLIDTYESIMIHYSCRGPVAMAAAYWLSNMTPYFLPEEWCACGGYTEFKMRSRKRIDPIFLHVGHEDVMDWFNREPAFEKFRA